VGKVRNAELKEAMMAEEPVIYNDIEYKCISAIIYRKNINGSGIYIQAELADKKTHSVTIADASRVLRKN
jgi:hypothetical protein